MIFEAVRIDTNVIQDDILVLKCSMHSDQHWCGCRKTVVLDNLDGPALWHAIATKIRTKSESALRNPFQVHMWVPIITSVPFGIAVRILVQEPLKFKKPEGFRPGASIDAKVSFSFHDDSVNILEFLRKKGIKPFIGTLHAGEGREVLRNMVRNALDPVFKFDITACASTHHDEAAERTWKMGESSVVGMFVRNWSLVVNAGICDTCLRRKIELADALGVDHRTMV